MDQSADVFSQQQPQVQAPAPPPPPKKKNKWEVWMQRVLLVAAIVVIVIFVGWLRDRWSKQTSNVEKVSRKNLEDMLLELVPKND